MHLKESEPVRVLDVERRVVRVEEVISARGGIPASGVRGRSLGWSRCAMTRLTRLTSRRPFA
jgi:hypothetical protein